MERYTTRLAPPKACTRRCASGSPTARLPGVVILDKDLRDGNSNHTQDPIAHVNKPTLTVYIFGYPSHPAPT
ncbi:hypothetical protein RSOLAG1IB_03695 [Rhizoctonia solani AG-1 IB]|uniref:Uncharacterized protein n=1 Tax=Thanatephorus cucumeris (strain AG1-IB / isolate 7/3/14) TaxID=1108050 RepID=A0A0B7FP71_THACB|nr:hypothetical protein RSOLAG1IB_03695 [Rhizoctonia solani AG-1 IB]